MDKAKLKKDLGEWQELYTGALRSKLALQSTDDLRRAMSRLEYEYSEQRLEGFTRNFMIASLVAESRDSSLLDSYAVLGHIDKDAADSIISKSVSKFIQTISKAEEDENTIEMNTELVEKLREYE
ncbi:hypothetical protein ACHRVW_16865 [Flavobacterium collinsii]|uniref:hypothetical protein n=1 Tax=Flavobacterium collinsii TaxID=1114861 RepID=UPI0037568E0D